MKNSSPIAVVFGTRPEIIKLAPVISELKQQSLKPTLIFTGQHRDLADPLLKQFNLKIDFDLNLMRHSQTLSELSSRLLSKLPQIYKQIQFKLTIVQGDTPTAAMAAWNSYYYQVPIAHVEAGLRSGNFYHPFPEEGARVTIDHLSALHFAPTKSAYNNLVNENIPPQKITITGNTGLDSLSSILKQQNLTPHRTNKPKHILITLHRRESWDHHIKQTLLAINQIMAKYPVHVTYPFHPNPVIKKQIHQIFKNNKNIQIIDPLDYHDMVQQLTNTHLIITDSGGIQEEATFLGIPTFVIRETTERQEGVKAGVLKLIGRNPQALVANFDKIYQDKKLYQKMSKPSTVFGDGQASRQISTIISHFLSQTNA